MLRRRRRRIIFQSILHRNAWRGKNSVSGPGSDPDETKVLEQRLPELLARLGVRTMLDVPCGDFQWMSRVALPVDKYIGGDIVPELVDALRKKHADGIREFRVMDLVEGRLPTADLIFCRDVLGHLSTYEAVLALQNLARSNCRWVLLTHFLEDRRNRDVPTGSWRPLNLTLPPFSLPPPQEVIIEESAYEAGKWADKTMALWSREQLKSRE
jgi:SAM-dependent methyltransferase